MDKAQMRTKSYARLPNPPKSPRLTKAWAREVRSLLTELDYRLFISRLLERPSLGLKDEWLWEMRDRMCAVLAQVNTWHDNELKERRKRKCSR